MTEKPRQHWADVSCTLQAYLDPLNHPSYACYSSPFGSIRPLLQAFSTIPTDSHICNITRNLSGPNFATGHLRLDSSRFDSCTRHSSCRNFILLPIFHLRSRPQHPTTTPDARRDREIFFTNSSAEILTISPAVAIAFLSSLKRSYNYSL